MMATVLSFWTEEKITDLTWLWSKGDSAQLIARALKTTRNAVLGKVHRLGLPHRSTAAAASARIKRPAEERPAPKRVNRRSVFKSAEIKPSFNAPNPKALPGLRSVTSVLTGSLISVKRRATVPELTKPQLRAQLMQAVLNTAAMEGA